VALKKLRIQSAAEKIHKVFIKYAENSPQMLGVTDGPPEMLSMQHQVYIMGSRSDVVLAQRARSSESLFLDVLSFKWDISCLTTFQVATWIRSRVSLGAKTAGRSAGATLKFVKNCTGWRFHLTNPIVIAQIKSFGDTDATREPSAKALTPSVDVVMQIEDLIRTAPTAQLRCMAGLLTLLAYGSGRASDVLASRNLVLAKDAVVGESLMKNKYTWTKWFVCRQGLRGNWADTWFEILAEEGLPRSDFVIWAPNGTFDAWLGRPAEYADVRRALHFILHSQCNLSIEESIAYNPHGMRHFMIDSGQQLRALKICSAEDIEKFGHWNKGSAMTEAYDNAAGVSELMARHVVLGAVRSGWRPAAEGELPNPLPAPTKHSAGSSTDGSGEKGTFITVGNPVTKRLHLSDPHAKVSRCKMFAFETHDGSAVFGEAGDGWGWCKTCSRDAVG